MAVVQQFPEIAPYCPSCACEMVWQECEECDDGETFPGVLYESDPLWYDPDDTEPCHVCDGTGGWWACPNTRDWCEQEGQRIAAHERRAAEP